MKKTGKTSGKTLYGVVKVSSKGQIIIPVDLRNDLGIKNGDQLYILRNKNNDILIVTLDKMENMLSEYGLRGGIDSL